MELSMIAAVEQLNQTAYSLWAQARQIAPSCLPGNFLHIRCGDDVYLRRPISVCDVEGDRVRLVFDVRGRGTEWLAGRRAGERLDILGPLGNSFEIPASGAPVLLMGGGIGVPPLLFCARKLAQANPGARPDMVMGFKTARAALMEEDFRAVCGEVRLSTDDGSLGAPGYAADCARGLLEKKRYAAVYACGPKPMLRAAAALAREFGVPCRVSMEERMGCGVGACLVCACRVRADTEEGFAYRHVCKDGPVFDAGEVFFE